MSAISSVMVFLLFGWDLLQAPPRDLASLVDPVKMLEQMQIRTDEESLIELLQARHEEQRVLDELPGPRGDTEYVKRLLAIRALEAMKSGRAAPVLEKIAAEEDVTLADAATQAVAIIGGREAPRSSGLETLKVASDMVPPDAGFVLALDIERGSKTVTLADWFAVLREKMAPARGMLFSGGDGLDQVTRQAEEGVVLALSLVGNIRLDSVTVVCSNDIGRGEDMPYICLIAKGLYDPARVASVCRTGIGEPLEIEGHAVFQHEGNNPAVCLLNEHTAIISFGPRLGPRHMERVLQGIAARKDTALPGHAARAFELIAQKQARMAGSGALTDAQKAMIEEETGEELARMEQTPRPGQEAQMELDALRIGLALAKVDLFEGHSTDEGKLTLTATCRDADAAAELAGPLSRLEENLRQQLLANMGNVPEPLRPLFQDVARGAPHWQTTLRGRQVVVQVEPLRLATLGMMVGVRTRSEPVRMEPVEPEVAEPVPVGPVPAEER